MSELTPCPECDSTKRPLTEWDGYDSCMTCIDCGYFTGWKYLYPTAEEVWNRDYENKGEK